MRLPWRRKPGTQLQLVSRSVPSRVAARHNALRRESEILTRELEEGVKGKVKDADALVASGTLITHGKATYLRRLIQPWQIRAFGYYDLIGEIKYAAQFYSRALSNLELFAAEVDEDGMKVPTEDKEVKDALARIKDPGGTSRKGLLADYGRLMFLAGETLLFVWWNPETEMEQWEMLSTDELRALDGDYTRFSAPSLPATNFQPMPDDAYVPVPQTAGRPKAVAYRLWKRHPRFSQLPDAPMEGVLELCEELVLLTHAVRARARSRLAGSGILFIDDRITTRPAEVTPDEDMLEDPFLADLTEAMTLPITDEGTAEAVVPLLARVKVPDGVKLADLVYHLQIVDPTQLYPETNLRIECVRRIATCLDMPPEVLLGLGTLNHWNVWGIDEQSWKYHLQPMAEHLVADLTSAYLSPYLKNVLDRSDWQRFCIDYDASKVINHPDRSKDYFQAHDRGIIGDEAVRDAIGASEDDKPTEEELARIIGMKINDGSLAWFGEPAPRGGTVEIAPGTLVSGQPAPGTAAPAGTTGPAAQSTGASTQKGPPPGGPEPGGGLTSAGLPVGIQNGLVVTSAVMGVAQLGMLRAREAAGARIRTLCRRDEAALAMIDGMQARDIAPTLGRAKVREVGGREAELVAQARPLIQEGLRSIGLLPDTAVEAICETLEKHAVRTLYDPRPALLPQSFETYVAGLLVASNG